MSPRSSRPAMYDKPSRSPGVRCCSTMPVSGRRLLIPPHPGLAARVWTRIQLKLLLMTTAIKPPRRRPGPAPRRPGHDWSRALLFLRVLGYARKYHYINGLKDTCGSRHGARSACPRRGLVTCTRLLWEGDPTRSWRSARLGSRTFASAHPTLANAMSG